MISSISLFGVSHIDLKIKCDNCENEFISDSFYIPSPDYTADTARDSSVMESENFDCPSCDRNFEVTIYSSYAGADVELDIEEDSLLEIIPHYNAEYEEYIDEEIERVLEEKEYFANFNQGTNDLDQIVKLDANDEIRKILLYNAYAGLVTHLEAYLYGVFVKKILTDRTSYKDFIEKFLDFKTEKFTLNQFFEVKATLDKKVKKALSELMYHNLHKIKPIAEKVFKIAVPDISEIMKIVNLRHDIVHRNGKNMDGEEIAISVESYKVARDLISQFVEEFENQVHGF